MSSKTLNKKFEDTLEEDIINQPVNLKEFVIPFSEFGRTKKYIYLGPEKIPFKERHPIYQMILKKIINKPEELVSKNDLLGLSEKKKILEIFNNTQVHFPRNIT